MDFKGLLFCLHPSKTAEHPAPFPQATEALSDLAANG